MEQSQESRPDSRCDGVMHWFLGSFLMGGNQKAGREQMSTRFLEARTALSDVSRSVRTQPVLSA